MDLMSSKFVRGFREGGFTLIEILVVLVLLTGTGFVLMTNYFALKSKQALLNDVHKFQVLVDEARSKSVAVDSGLAWGVYVDVRTKENYATVFSFDPSVNFKYSSIPKTSNSLVLSSGVNFEKPLKSGGQRLFLTFNKLTGYPVLYPAKSEIKDQLNLTLVNQQWSAFLTVDSSGSTSVSKLFKN